VQVPEAGRFGPGALLLDRGALAAQVQDRPDPEPDQLPHARLARLRAPIETVVDAREAGKIDRSEAAAREEGAGLLDHLVAAHDERVRVRQDDEIAHPVHAGPLDGDDAVVLAGDDPRQGRHDATIAGDDADLEIDSAQDRGQIVRPGAKLPAGRPGVIPEVGELPQKVDQLAS
jgi:hypothetical protein